MSNIPDKTVSPAVSQVPPASLASPSELRPRTPNDMRWYKPSLAETAQLMGWRWLWFAPAVALLLLPFFLPILSLFVVWWKLIIPAVGLPAGYAANMARHILRTRKEPFCIHCGYDLSGLPDNHTCPECGEYYTHKLVEEYKRDPVWFIKRYRLHGDIPVRDVPFEAGKTTRRKSRDGT